MTTVGYGDISATSFFGRFVAIVICFWGLLIVSLVVMTVTDQFELSHREDKSFKMMKRLILKKKLKVQAVSLCQTAYLYRQKCKKTPHYDE